MNAEPVQIQGATIVISNPELVPYLLGKTAAQVRDDALRAAARNIDAQQAEVKSKPANPQAVPAADKAKSAGGGAL
jgi:hypothetical protein